MRKVLLATRGGPERRAFEGEAREPAGLCGLVIRNPFRMKIADEWSFVRMSGGFSRLLRTFRLDGGLPSVLPPVFRLPVKSLGMQTVFQIMTTS